MYMLVYAKEGPRSLHHIHLGLGTSSFTSRSTFRKAVGKKVVSDNCKMRTCRQPTQRRGHGMRNDRLEDDGLIASQLVHFSAPKSVLPRTVNRGESVPNEGTSRQTRQTDINLKNSI